jgi:tetratricopeptide (TPR) repeat protein
VQGASVRRAAPALGIGALIVLALAARTFDYERAWSSDLALWRHATSTHPDAFYAWLKLGEHLRDGGRLDAAIDAYARAIDAAPDLKLSHSAYFNAVAMRDEARAHLPARSLTWTERYYAALDDAGALRSVAGDMAEAGYRDAVMLALGRSFDIAPVEDARLAHAASVQLELDHEWLARFYVSRMIGSPDDPALRALRE